MSAEIVQVLNERAGCGLELVGLIDEGQSGAAYVRWPDGRDSVVTTAFATMEQMRLTAETLVRVRRLDIPVPHHEFLYDLDDGTVAVVQERMPGATVVAAGTHVVAAIIAMNDRFAGLLAGRPDISLPALSLGRPGDPINVEPIENHSSRAKQLVQAIRATADHRDADMTGDDLVHVDLTVPNMLFEDDRITGVIDWNYGIARGDRLFGVVKLLHTLSFDALAETSDARPSPEAINYVERVLAERLDPTIFPPLLGPSNPQHALQQPPMGYATSIRHTPAPR